MGYNIIIKIEEEREMAQYTINYACGHTGTVNLHGKTRDCASKAEWLAGQNCPECWKTEKFEQIKADETPVSINISLNTANLSNNNEILINAVAEGGTYREKENLKALGFKFGDAPMSGMFGLFAKPQKAWYKIIAVATINSIMDALKFGDYPVVNGISEIDIAAMRDKLIEIDAANKAKAEAAKEKAEKQALIGKSPLRTWIEKEYGHPYWNGKVYEGNVKYNKPSRVYLDNKEVEIPADVYAAQVEWRKRRDEINAKEVAK